MKICVINSVCPPFESRLFHREIRSLVRAGHQVTLIGPYDRPEGLVDSVRILGFTPQIALPLRPLNWMRIVARLRSVPADAYHFHDAELLPMGLMLARLTGKPVVYDCFEHYPRAILSDERFPTVLRPLLSRLYGGFETYVAERLAAVIVLALYAGDDPRFGRVQRLAHIRNLPWREMFDPLPSENTRKRQLIHVGDISESRRGISILIEMLALMRNADVPLLLVGRCDSPQTETQLRKLIAERGLNKRVQFVGQVPYEQIKHYLVESAIGLIPLKAVQRWEFDIPQKTFEYMACRLPFVASTCCSMQKFLHANDCGLLVETQSPQAFATAVDFLLDHPEEARRLGENGRRAFENEYNWEKESRKLIALYAELERAYSVHQRS